MSVNEAEPVMLEQISRISQQIGYYLHRASMRSGGRCSAASCTHRPLLDSLTSALNKVYQRKGVNIPRYLAGDQLCRREERFYGSDGQRAR
jgi:two-component system sensor histidine kinase PhoQ